MYKLRAVFVYADNTKKIDFMKEKLSYTAPAVETLVVRFEGVVCWSNPAVLEASGVFGADNAAGATLIQDLGYDL